MLTLRTENVEMVNLNAGGNTSCYTAAIPYGPCEFVHLHLLLVDASMIDITTENKFVAAVPPGRTYDGSNSTY